MTGSLSSLPSEFRSAEVLEACRRYLLALAQDELPADLQAKGGASDLVQQTLAAAVRCGHQFRGRSLSELRAWLRSILANEAAAFRRRYAGTASRAVGREVPLDGADAQDDRTPIADVLQNERADRLAAAVAQLPDDMRTAVTLRVDHDMSFADIGTRLGRTEEAARKLFTRALDRLRGRLPDSSVSTPS